MTVDRAFPFVTALVLAGSTAGACHIYVDEPPPRGAAAAPPRPAAPPPQVHPAAPAAPVHLAAASSPPVVPAHATPIHLAGATPGGSVPVASTTPAPGGAATATPPPAPACLDTSSATVPDCTTLRAPDASCTSPLPRQKCAIYKTLYDPKIAAQAISCMASLSSKQMCDPTQLTSCGKSALAQACADPAVGQLCAIAVTPCKSTQAECTSLVSGLNDQGQDQVAACIAQGCTGGLQACVDGLH